ncbi:FapA family protein [Desulfonatronum lacustre]|uniref:FapA family protein n=1 Tax=Desulfonatronum lacustre TaxID=66849 RepID=UPI00048AC671|nr:FapA family protein [Desulfonatronum lacustre]
MRQTVLTLTAASSGEATAMAVADFHCPPESVGITVLEDGRFRAELLDHDADIQVEISPDKMKATIVGSIPAKGKGSPLNLESLLKKLTEAGVRVSPDPDVAARVVEQLFIGTEVAGTVIAKGILARPAKDASITPLGDWDFPAFPGDAIAGYVPAQPSEAGLLVTGEQVSPPASARGPDIEIAQDAGCSLDRDASMVIAEQYGLPNIEDHRVSVQSLLSFVDNNMAIKATIYHRTFKDEPTGPHLFQHALQRMQVKAPLQEESVSRAAAKAKERGAPVENVILCWGKLPKDGVDGSFEPTMLSTPDALGLETADGRIDFRARGVVRAVNEGDILGRLISSQPGEPGIDVFGKPVSAKQGRPFTLLAGENVRCSEEGSEYSATASGMVFFQGNTLKVTEVFETKSDVNLEVGNIKLERGSVNIRGSVLSGFCVEAPGNVVVKDVVENAVIIAGGEVQVGCGIIMDQGGKVEAGGGISALYAQNAVLLAQGDVNIAHEINNCKVTAKRNIIATRGRGKIIGGILRCGEGVLAKEIGSPAGVETQIYLGANRVTEVNMERKKELEETLQKIYTSLGSGDIKSILERAPSHKRQIVAEVLKARVRCEQELSEIEQQIREERENFRTDMNLRVKAQNIIHPDVVILCFTASYKVTTPLAGPTIYYDSQQNRLVLA